jgi:hypothetical protein
MMQNSFTQQFNFLTDFAKQQLQKYSEFYPFGSVVEANGELHGLAVQVDSDHPTSKVLLDEYDKVIPSLIKNKSIAAAAVCLDAATGLNRDTDAIVLEIENAAGEAATVFVSYKRTAKGVVEYGEPRIQERAPKWFGRNLRH